MKTYVLALLLCIPALLSFSQNIKLKSKGEVDVAFVYKDPSGYFKYPMDRTFQMRTKQSSFGPDGPGLHNLSSMALRVRAWEVLGEIVIHPVLVYSLNKEGLSGNKHHVFYHQISKYPDLVKRYNAVRPTSFYAVVGMGLNPENEYEYGAYAFFNITNSDVVITSSERTPNYDVPATSTWGSTVIMVHSDEKHEYWFRKPKDFKPSDAQKATLQKYLSKATRAASYAWAKVQTGTVRKQYPEDGNIHLMMTWPGDEIDAIHDLYLKYESGQEKPPSKEAQEALAKKDLDPYQGNDEWGSAFEDDLKDVQAVNDYQKKMIALKSKNRVITTFDNDQYSNIAPLNKTSFFLLTGRNNKKYIVDKRGNKQSISGHQSFDYVSVNDRGEITAEVSLSARQFIKSESGLGLVGEKFYSSHSEAASAVQSAIARKEQAAREEWAKKTEAEKKRAMNTYELTFSHSYESERIKRLVTNSQLNVLSTKEGYVIR